MGLTLANPATRLRAAWQADEVMQLVWGMEYIETPADGRFGDAAVDPSSCSRGGTSRG